MSKARRKEAAVNKQQQERARLIIFVAAVVVVVVGAISLLYVSSLPESAEPAEAEMQAALASEFAPTLGDPDAKVHIVEYLDPACGTCAMFYPMVKRWMAEAPDKLRLSVRHIAFHQGADFTVKVLEASRNQELYWETLEALLMSQRNWVTNHVVQQDRVIPAIADVGLDIDRLIADMNSAEVLQRIEKDKQDAITLQISATPTYFVNGRPLPSFGQQQLLDLVREELEKAY
ncbi:MAG: thioredoxin domain-containing protein [Woeseiaceae bacterium]